MTERGGGIVPGPVVEHMRAAAVFPGAANVANVDAGPFTRLRQAATATIADVLKCSARRNGLFWYPP